MKRRFIRSFFIGLLVLCVGGWVGSYRYDWVISHSARYHLGLECTWGRIWLGWLDMREVFFGSSQWNAHTFVASSTTFNRVEKRYHHFIGFHFINEPDEKCIIIPLWFPTTISAALLWLVWRKTRQKVKGRAFPVEMKEKHP